MPAAIVDTGPLVAYFDRREPHHEWAAAHMDEMDEPLLVCEPVLTEAMFLLRAAPKAREDILELVEHGTLRIPFGIEEHAGAIRRLMHKYRDVPMSLADACVVQMAELFDRHAVLTLDSDFNVYRKHGRTPLHVIHPYAS